MAAGSELYLRPTGLMTGAAAANACAAGLAARLAGGPVAFSAAEVVRRKGAARDIEVCGLDALRSCRLRDDVERSAAIEERLQIATASRPPFAGLTIDRPRLMGVVNVTPDSFSDGGRYASRDAAIAHGEDGSAQPSRAGSARDRGRRRNSDLSRQATPFVRELGVAARLRRKASSMALIRT